VALEGREGDLRVVTRAGELTGRLLVNCAGLQSDLVAEMMGLRPEVRIVPFRGEYFLLRPDRAQLVRGLVYPVPDPAFPFLGVHLTRTVTDQVEAGPNAVLALAREGYRHRTIRPAELWGTLAYPGFWRLAGRHWRSGMAEVYRSFSKRGFVRALRRLVPELGGDDLVGRGAGVRAQAVDREGRLVDDFSIVRTASSVHVLNAPSPAATASLAIGDQVADLALEVLGARA
jgi:L-2-hydroxyglutarate oxidase